MTELIWDGKYKDGDDGKPAQKVAPARVALPFQTVETVNESAQLRQRAFDLFSAGRDAEWRNRLIWGDKKYVLPSLLPEFAGKVNLIYIDPPFNVGADFSFTATIPDNPDTDDDETTSFVKAPSVIEMKAYRDTWGRGLDSYLQWFYETAILLRELLAETGFIFVHLDYHVSYYAKIIMDEVFGSDNFRNEVIVKRPISKNLQAQFESINALSWGHDSIFWYSKDASTRMSPIYTNYQSAKPEGYWHHFWSNADRPTLRYELLGVTPKTGQWKYNKERALVAAKNYQEYLQVAPNKSLVEYWEETGRGLDFIRLSKSGKVENWFPPSDEKLADTLWTDIAAYENQKLYATQKHAQLLERILKASSNENDLVLDCFCGSGTTAAVAEKLNRRWITADLGRFAIHTTRKRLLSIENVRPFVVQNLGKYERQVWQAAEFQTTDEGRQTTDDGRQTTEARQQQAYREFILKLYNARGITGYSWLHGLKNGRMVHVGAVDSPVSVGDVKNIVAEFKRAIGTGKDAPATNGVDVLGWDFAFELNEVAIQQAAQANVNVKFLRIPREVLEKKAVEQGDIRFFELAALKVKVEVSKKPSRSPETSKVSGARAVTLTLQDFVIPPDDVPEDVQRAIKHWSQWIDYWAVDWDNKGDTFHNEWQTYRTRKNPELQKSVAHTYDAAGEYTIVVKVIDILGNDTTKTARVKVE